MSSLFLYSRLWWFVQVSVVSTTRRYFRRLYAIATNCVLSRSRIYFSHSHVSFLCAFCVEKWTRNVNDAIARKCPYFWAYIKIWNYCCFEEVVKKIELTYSNGSIWPRGPPPPIFCFPDELEKRFRFVIFFSLVIIFWILSVSNWEFRFRKVLRFWKHFQTLLIEFIIFSIQISFIEIENVHIVRDSHTWWTLLRRFPIRKLLP